MVDFLIISMRSTKNGVEIYPKFRLYPKSQDLMIRGGDFYAVWIEELSLWSTNEDDALSIIDSELRKRADEYAEKHPDTHVNVLYTWDSSSGSIDAWHKYCQKQKRDSFVMLDESLVFSNTNTTKQDYASKRLPYPLEKGSISAYDKLISTLYNEEERHKLEWAIGAIVTGDSKHIQKFLVLYGAAGTGKSTILNIVQQLFDGYYSVFDAKALGTGNNQFALEAFKKNPLVAIQHDGDLSRIEDNTRLNSLVSHELMTVNEKHKGLYENRFKCFLFMGTNKPVKITDGKSGIIRRLIDVTPSGNKLDSREYKRIIKQVDFELGAIAWHCKEVYLENPGAYDHYIPTSMMGATNDFYNFVVDSYHIFKKEDGTTLKAAWEMYKNYCDDAKVPFPYSQRSFKEELKNYFKDYDDKFDMGDGTKTRCYYSRFKTDIFETEKKPACKKQKNISNLIDFEEQESIFDKECSECPAQYASAKETPSKKWDDVKTTLEKIDTSRIHYVKIPENHIVIDFDIKDENGNKSFEKNLEAASKWPATYAELSKSGNGIHLHYIYKGDVTKLSRVYADNIEIKVFTGKSSLRRRLTKCNDLPIKIISSGLPVKGEKKMVSADVIKSEKGLRSMIKRNMEKEFHPGTKPSVDFIYKILEDAYERGMKYDLSDMKNEVYAFAMNSTNQSDYCIKLVNQMHFKSEEVSKSVDIKNEKFIFYDIEVFPNLFLVNWKLQGKENPVIRMINPSPSDIEELLQYRLIGYNCRRYDNHIIYARLMGYDNEQLYNLSQRIIKGEKNAFFGEAYNLSYTDVYDFAVKKQSLKKWEIELGIHHQELGLPWDQPVPEERWVEVAEYCDNDVIATEAVFEHLSADWLARQILADLAGMTVNDTTNSLTTRIIFGKEKKPQGKFCYRDMSKPINATTLGKDVEDFISEACPTMMSQTHGDKLQSVLPYFPGYKYEFGKSTYRGEEVGEGGYVYAEPGIHCNVALLDVASMHPHSVIAECLFGPEFTRRFRDLVKGRVYIKHEDWDSVSKILDGKLTPYVQKVINGELTSKQLSTALKLAINSVYGLTAANFDNQFRDIRNKDNIVAKRGALFMIDLKNEVQKRGFTVAHVKTDSIKIPNATPEIIQFVMDFGQKYGYTFEHEATYEKMCLVNDAVYIAKYDDGEWTATGTQFQVPYVFKTLFSKEPIEFKDMCETKSVTSTLYLDMNENLPDVSGEEKELAKAETQFKKKLISDEEFDSICNELKPLIETGHDYKFIGKVGSFCPIIPGKGGGLLVREKDGKYYAATGTKGYRWLESEIVKGTNEEYIDRSYYNALVDGAVETISQYGDFEWFISDDPYISDKKPKSEPYPPCGEKKYETCFDCPKFDSHECKIGYCLDNYLVQNK